MNFRVAAGVLCACSVLGAAYAAAPLSPSELRGRQIYLKGESTSGQSIPATIGNRLKRGRSGQLPSFIAPFSAQL